MATSKLVKKKLLPPPVGRQVAFHQLLVATRRTMLLDALSEVLAAVDPSATHTEIKSNVPKDALQILAASGIRDEHVFPTCQVLIAKPTLIGYYRLLLGAPQKSFYAGSTGLGVFKSAETGGALTQNQRELLPQFCAVMCRAMTELVRQISPAITHQDVAELPLLTLGSQLQGANNNTIGKQATDKVFLALAAFVRRYVTEKSERSITLKNASGRTVFIRLAADPDVEVIEDFAGTARPVLAIEIKGGADRSNAHNRAGEAEKSHQKAKIRRFAHFWTLISTSGLDIEKLSEESPTTTEWFDVAHVLAQSGSDWSRFRSHLSGILGIPDN